MMRASKRFPLHNLVRVTPKAEPAWIGEVVGYRRGQMGLIRVGVPDLGARTIEWVHIGQAESLES